MGVMLGPLPKSLDGCFYNLEIRFLDVLIIRALLD